MIQTDLQTCLLMRIPALSWMIIKFAATGCGGEPPELGCLHREGDTINKARQHTPPPEMAHFLS